MKISSIIKTAAVSLAMVLVGANAVAPVFAADVNCPEGSIHTTAATIAECNVTDNTSKGGLMPTLNIVLNVVFGVIGFVAVVMLVYGGIQYTISSGDAGKVKKAKDTILYGIVGLIIALLAAAIVNFVLAGVFKAA